MSISIKGKAMPKTWASSGRSKLSVLLAVAAGLCLTSIGAARADGYYYRYKDSGLSSVVGPAAPDAGNQGGEPPARQQLSVSAPTDVFMRVFDSPPADARVVTRNAAAPVTYSISPHLPWGLALGADGVIRGQSFGPSPKTTYTIQASDGVAGALGQATASFDLTIAPRIPLEIAGPSSFSFEQYDSTKSLRLSPADNVTIYGRPIWSVPMLPAWMTTSYVGNDLVISGIPAAIDPIGVDLSFTLADEHGVSSVHKVHVDVTPVTGAEIKLPDALETDVAILSQYHFDVAGNTGLTKVLAGDVTWSVTLEQAGDSMVPGLELTSDGIVQGQPSAAGTFTFAIHAESVDGVNASHRYSVTVLP